MTVHAIYENGVFVPKGKVDLPDKTAVTFEPKPDLPFDETRALEAMKGVREVLARRVVSGDRTVGERHNEHTP
jgi:predicted DNA-binding antitoxin AbrB/MazE fold protein